MFNVTLSNGKQFLVKQGQTILEAAKHNSIAIAHSCRLGRCGACAAPLLSGETKISIAEASLSNSDLSSGLILTCCRIPTSDIHLDTIDLGEIGDLNTITLPCKVDRITRLCKDVLEIVFRFPPNAEFKFIPGQYIDLVEGDCRRSYSIANARRDDKKIELHVKKYHNGIMSGKLFSTTKQNDLFRVEGPFGTFSYRDSGEETVIFIATGTGLAPVKSLIEGNYEVLKRKKIYLFWGARYKEEFYLDLSSFESQIATFQVLSREKEQGFSHGYVQHEVLRQNLDLSTASVYACGSEAMINDARQLLLVEGLHKNRFHSDAFVSSE